MRSYIRLEIQKEGENEISMSDVSYQNERYSILFLSNQGVIDNMLTNIEGSFPDSDIKRIGEQAIFENIIDQYENLPLREFSTEVTKSLTQFGAALKWGIFIIDEWLDTVTVVLDELGTIPVYYRLSEDVVELTTRLFFHNNVEWSHEGVTEIINNNMSRDHSLLSNWYPLQANSCYKFTLTKDSYEVVNNLNISKLGIPVLPNLANEFDFKSSYDSYDNVIKTFEYVFSKTVEYLPDNCAYIAQGSPLDVLIIEEMLDQNINFRLFYINGLSNKYADYYSKKYKATELKVDIEDSRFNGVLSSFDYSDYFMANAISQIKKEGFEEVFGCFAASYFLHDWKGGESDIATHALEEFITMKQDYRHRIGKVISDISFVADIEVNDLLSSDLITSMMHGFSIASMIPELLNSNIDDFAKFLRNLYFNYGVSKEIINEIPTFLFTPLGGSSIEQKEALAEKIISSFIEN